MCWRTIIACLSWLTLQKALKVQVSSNIVDDGSGISPCIGPSMNFRQVNTYGNPVLPVDHPDATFLKVGDNFYHCGSGYIAKRPSAITWQRAVTRLIILNMTR